ncbi:hypothetical protein EUGRSUZ_C00011 [Eucalyptus grandis]|uniref:Uncharacterized protein n=2 Tax=Eucalyptus grandis TaxID=71139 RepID=A0ACC3L9A8_EUCGR|nr:hypothetical protein EUGRSUZ_C00011 [Eucalyptus grandis]
MPGLVPGETGLTDDGQDSFVVLSNSSKQCFNILCSGDENGVLCFSIFGVFPIGNVVSLLSVSFLASIEQSFLINGSDGRNKYSPKVKDWSI